MKIKEENNEFLLLFSHRKITLFLFQQLKRQLPAALALGQSLGMALTELTNSPHKQTWNRNVLDNVPNHEKFKIISYSTIWSGIELCPSLWRITELTEIILSLVYFHLIFWSCVCKMPSNRMINGRSQSLYRVSTSLHIRNINFVTLILPWTYVGFRGP